MTDPADHTAAAAAHKLRSKPIAPCAQPLPGPCSTDQPGFDVALAHCFARVALGLCIALHGYSRLPNLVGFADGMVKQFAATFLPSPFVYVTGFGVAIGEAIIGTLLVFGIFLRPTLVVGTLLMLQLIFGTTLVQQWEIVSIQLIYVAFYVGLLATVRHDRFSIDGLRRRGKSELSMQPS